MLSFFRVERILKPMHVKEWGNLDLNQGPAGYEGGGNPHHSTPPNRYQQHYKQLAAFPSTGFYQFVLA